MEQLQADVKVHSIQHMEHLMWLKLFQGSICTTDPDLNPYREKGGGGGWNCQIR
jgi:hypothetical protein